MMNLRNLLPAPVVALLFLMGCGPRTPLPGTSGQDGTATGVTSELGTTAGATTDGIEPDSSGSETTAGPSAPTCEQPVPILLGGRPTGFVECADGGIDRPEPLACAQAMPGNCEGTEEVLGCLVDADCTAQPNGVCMHQGPRDVGITSCSCEYPCSADADCEDGRICRCAQVGAEAPRNECIEAGCTEDADCPSGRCGLSRWTWCNDNWCAPGSKLACRTPDDVCTGPDDCDEASCAQCSPQLAWSCKATAECTCEDSGCF